MGINQTSYKSGQSGNPNGRPLKEYSITEAIRGMMTENPEIKTALAEKVIAMALKGDMTAIKTLWGHLDGLPVAKQEIERSEDYLPVPLIPLPCKHCEKDAQEISTV